MFKIFSRLAQTLKSDAEPAEAPVWVRDPLSHPAIEAMDARALGDLPFGIFRSAANEVRHEPAKTVGAA